MLLFLLTGVFMLVRLYLLGRYLRSTSSLYSQWVAFIGKLSLWISCEVDLMF